MPRVFTALVVLLLLAVVHAVVRGLAAGGAFMKAADVRVGDPAGAVSAARLLIERKRQAAGAFGDATEPSEPPVELKIEHLRYAQVHVDHVDLVLARNPDVSTGARIWAIRHRPHRDEPTQYRDIWFYRYSHEAEPGLTNIP
jgi:hypothetical protein